MNINGALGVNYMVIWMHIGSLYGNYHYVSLSGNHYHYMHHYWDIIWITIIWFGIYHFINDNHLSSTTVRSHRITQKHLPNWGGVLLSSCPVKQWNPWTEQDPNNIETEVPTKIMTIWSLSTWNGDYCTILNTIYPFHLINFVFGRPVSYRFSSHFGFFNPRYNWGCSIQQGY